MITPKTILFFIILVSIIDIFANVISFIPIIGGILESISETMLEIIQIGLAGLLVAWRS